MIETGQKYQYKYGHLIVEILGGGTPWMGMPTKNVKILEGKDIFPRESEEDNLLESSLNTLFEVVK